LAFILVRSLNHKCPSYVYGHVGTFAKPQSLVLNFNYYVEDAVFL